MNFRCMRIVSGDKMRSRMHFGKLSLKLCMGGLLGFLVYLATAGWHWHWQWWWWRHQICRHHQSVLLLYINKMLMICSFLSRKVKTQYLHFRLHANYFLLPWKIPAEISRRPMLFNNERQYLPCQTYVDTTFYDVRDWHEIGRLIEVSTLFYICTYCVFTLYGSIAVLFHWYNVEKAPLFVKSRQKELQIHFLEIAKMSNRRVIFIIFH